MTLYGIKIIRKVPWKAPFPQFLRSQESPEWTLGPPGVWEGRRHRRVEGEDPSTVSGVFPQAALLCVFFQCQVWNLPSGCPSGYKARRRRGQGAWVPNILELFRKKTKKKTFLDHNAPDQKCSTAFPQGLTWEYH